MSSMQSLDGRWLLAVDPDDIGRQRKWFEGAVPQAKETQVPWIIQDAFPGYHGVAWYWRDFSAPANPHAGGRCLLRFWAVDYKAEVWLNDTLVGGHEGGETPFVLDVTDTILRGRTNRLALRVLNPTHDRIDGIVLNETPKQARVMPYAAGAAYNHGGITGSVELLIVPAVRVEDLFVRADRQSGVIRIQANVRNAGTMVARSQLHFSVAPATGGEMLQTATLERDLPPGDTLVEIDLQIDQPHAWDLNDPFLYRVTVRAGVDERSVRCGFRDFRIEGGCFRLNGRRVFLRSTHTCNHFPVGLKLPTDPDMARRDLLDLKVMGFNMIRFIWGGSERCQLDLCDEIGLMVYQESFAAWPMADSPQMGERFDRSVSELIRRDRNHPSIVIWGLLNESQNIPAFHHAAGMLPLVRALDDSRVVFLNAGRFDGLTCGREGVATPFGSVSNPGSLAWQDLLTDLHTYQRVPHTADTVAMLRSAAGAGTPLFLSEYGIGSAVDLWRVTRQFEQIGKTDVEDARFYRDKLDRYLADWDRWKLDELYARPQDFFTESLARMAGQRTLGLDAIRANPNIIGYSLTGMNDHVSCGEGLTTTFRELKPGTVDAMFEGFAPLRLCLFAEPLNVYRGSRVRLEAVLANEDALAAGEYRVRLSVVGPDLRRVLDRVVAVKIGKGESPFAMPIFAEDVVIDGPGGRYRFLASFESGGAPTGGQTEFHVADAADMPAVAREIVLAGEDADLADWLAAHAIRTRTFADAPPQAGEVILVCAAPADFPQLWRRIELGATAVFLSVESLKKDDQPLGWLPLANQGTLAQIWGWLYLKDEWAKRHPIFEGLPAGGLMDYTFYREIIPDMVLSGQDPPAEAIAGAIKASQDYASGLMLAAYRHGAGRFILNTLLIRENLGAHPAAERLLRNMLQ